MKATRRPSRYQGNRKAIKDRVDAAIKKRKSKKGKAKVAAMNAARKKRQSAAHRPKRPRPSGGGPNGDCEKRRGGMK